MAKVRSDAAGKRTSEQGDDRPNHMSYRHRSVPLGITVDVSDNAATWDALDVDRVVDHDALISPAE